jgi:hypothetical protein
MQNAVLVSEVGKPLVLGTRGIPEPGKGEILIKVESTMRTFLSCPSYVHANKFQSYLTTLSAETLVSSSQTVSPSS